MWPRARAAGSPTSSECPNRLLEQLQLLDAWARLPPDHGGSDPPGAEGIGLCGPQRAGSGGGRSEILRIFDEIISLRVALGGAQELCGVRPDLTTLGKIISGGMPMAGFGGREDIMALFDPRQRPPAISQSGTFNAAVVCCAAGVAGYGAITPVVLTHIDRLAENHCTRANTLFRRLDVPAQVVGGGSLFNIHFTREPIVNYRAVARGDRKTLSLLVLALMNRGIFLAPRGMGCTSPVMTTAEIDAFLSALEGVLVEDLEIAG